MGFWQNVDDECDYRGISRKELAAAVHFSVNTISSGIKRNGMPEADLALRIAKALDVPLEKLLPLEDCIVSIDTSEFERQQKLFTDYLPYVQKLNTLPIETRKAIHALIESL